MLKEVLSFLQTQLPKIGYESPVLLSFGLLLGHFATTLPERFRAAAQAAAGILVAAGVLTGLLRAFSIFFKNRPARGMIDGLAAGLIAGLVGGLFGYGWHTGPGYEAESSLLRIFYCTVFAVPVGGVLGFCFDLVHPDRRVEWRSLLGPVIISFGALFGLAGAGVVWFVPRMRGAGITVGDLQLLFEVHVFAAAMIACFYFACDGAVYVRRTIKLLVSIAVTRSITTLAPYDSICQPLSDALTKMQFLIPDPSCKEQPEWMAIAVAAFMVWSYATYAWMFHGQKPANAAAEPVRGAVPAQAAPTADDVLPDG